MKTDNKRWFVLLDLTVQKFTICDVGSPISVSGLHEYVLENSGRKTKKEALIIASKIKRLLKA